MNGKITLASLNCRGLGDLNKRKDVFNYLREKQFSIYCLQDTHFTAQETDTIRSQWGFECYNCPGSSNSRGVAVLFNNNFEFKVKEVIEYNTGNALILVLEIEKHFILTLVNLYGPNKDTPSFYSNLSKQLSELESDFTVICGDWNLVQNYDLDCYNYKTKNNPKSHETVLNLKETFNWVDPWRIQHPDTRRFTWFRRTPVKKSRLDFFLISEELMNRVEQTSILPGYKTDHSLITMELRLANITKGKGFWKFNNSLLKDSLYITKVKEIIEMTVNQYALPVYNTDYLVNNNAEEIQFSINDQLFF